MTWVLLGGTHTRQLVIWHVKIFSSCTKLITLTQWEIVGRQGLNTQCDVPLLRFPDAPRSESLWIMRLPQGDTAWATEQGWFSSPGQLPDTPMRPRTLDPFPYWPRTFSVPTNIKTIPREQISYLIHSISSVATTAWHYSGGFCFFFSFTRI